MKTAEEILDNYTDIYASNFERCFTEDDCIKAMKSYAMQECVKLRQQCADNVDEEDTFSYSSERNTYDLVEQSILSTPIELT